MQAQIIDGKALAAQVKAEAAAETAVLKAKGVTPLPGGHSGGGGPRQPGLCPRQGQGLR